MLRRLLVLLAVLVALTAAVGDAWLFLGTERERRRASANALLAAQAGLLAERLDRGVELWFTAVGLLGDRAELRQAADPGAALRWTLLDAAAAGAAPLWLGLLDAEGGLRGASDRLAGPGQLRELATRVAQLNRPLANAPKRGAEGLTIDLATPQAGGVLVARIPLDWAEALRRTGETRGPAGLGLALLTPAGEALLGERPVRGRLVAAAPVERLGLTVAATLPAEAGEQGLTPLGLRLAIGCAALALCAGLIAWRLGGSERETA